LAQTISKKTEKIKEMQLSELDNIVEKTVRKHSPVVIDNDYISILNHNLVLKKNNEEFSGKGISFRFKNISGSDIGKAVFKITFYDAKGNVLESIEKSTLGFEKEDARILNVESSKAQEVDISSYDVKIAKVIFPPAPVAKGNDEIKIVKHYAGQTVNWRTERPENCVNLAIKNISEKTISTAVFEVVFYDVEGNIIDTIHHKEVDLKPDNSRAITITTEMINDFPQKSFSYNIAIIKSTTADIEKVLIVSKEARTSVIGDGEFREEIRGLLRNISDVKTDATLVATFYDFKNEIIGTRIMPVDNITPGVYKRFHFIYDTPKGKQVKTFKLCVGEITENKAG
jgi:hypothetical protein